ncbi:MAG: acyltransferase [Lachnospiraceae bacterium]|nr:acyltransferase [Lachnospiraceae bacterium]
MVQRDLYADFLKGYAAILVVFGHLMTADAIEGGVCHIVYCSHMPVFFLVSGYFAVHIEQSSYREICKQKAVRFLIPFLSWTLVAVAAGNFNRLKNGLSVDICKIVIKEYLDNILWAKSMWFFLGIFETFILAKFFLDVWGKNKVLAIIFYVGLLCVPIPENLLAINRTRELFAFWWIGFWLKRYNIHLQGIDRTLIQKKYRYLVLGSIMLIIILLAFNPDFTVWLDNIFFKLCFELLCLSISLGMICPNLFRLKSVRKCGILVGTYSMECYCIHMMFVKYIVISLPFLREYISVSILFDFCKALIIAIICVIISKYALNKVKLYRKIMLGNWN